MTTTESTVVAVSDRAPGEILRRATFVSLVVGLAVIGLKFVAFTLTRSVALLSDARESIVDVVDAVAVPDGGSDLIAVVQVAAVEAGDLRVGAPGGPALVRLPLPYALPASQPKRVKL